MGSDDKAEILAAIDALGERIEARISVMEKKIDAIASHSLAPAELRAVPFSDVVGRPEPLGQ